jgi:hypothetical protein
MYVRKEVICILLIVFFFMVWNYFVRKGWILGREFWFLA